MRCSNLSRMRFSTSSGFESVPSRRFLISIRTRRSPGSPSLELLPIRVEAGFRRGILGRLRRRRGRFRGYIVVVVGLALRVLSPRDAGRRGGQRGAPGPRTQPPPSFATVRARDGRGREPLGFPERERATARGISRGPRRGANGCRHVLRCRGGSGEGALAFTSRCPKIYTGA